MGENLLDEFLFNHSPLYNAIATAVTQWTAGVAYLTLWQGATYQAATIKLPP